MCSSSRFVVVVVVVDDDDENTFVVLIGTSLRDIDELFMRAWRKWVSGERAERINDFYRHKVTKNS